MGDLPLLPSFLKEEEATHMLKTGIPIENIKVAGCGAGGRALASYLQEAESAAVLLRGDPRNAIRLKGFEPYEGPSPVPWSRLRPCSSTHSTC